ncbi:hypothetical protein LTR37_011766 [Vermiconidia calcicola]|uniref:Uncharacterized protein n=1 Tax=Vermiconidia calcicola TaxID=1690605 RepID=A0ACC3N1A5_9PEZI|nr:hypothetical protein LTR37_011766 [Vermiconidia calcicola]
MARRPIRLPFRIPFFRIFYSTTYTTIYILCIGLLIITPASMIWNAIQNSAFQYITVIGATYLFTALVATFIYASRLFTNRTVLAGVGKSFIPVEEGELGKGVRRLVKEGFEKSAVVAWESRPRDLAPEVATQAEPRGMLSLKSGNLGPGAYVVGKEIPVDPARPPWGHVRHAGWSSPSQMDSETPSLQFTTVIAEMPNLIEAKAVSLAPVDPLTTPSDGPPMADPVVAEVLRRPETMGMRDYLTQLSYLGLVNPQHTGRSFLQQYEKARFGGSAITDQAFQSLMAAFADLLAGMTVLDPAVIEQIREQAGDDVSSSPSTEDITPERLRSSSPYSPISSLTSPVTARTALSRSNTPYTRQEVESTESLGSVIRQTPEAREAVEDRPETDSLTSVSSDAGSVIRHRTNQENG